jgi:ribosomal protein S27E
MEVNCEHCNEYLGEMYGNTWNSPCDAEIELTGKVFARSQLVKVICPKCNKETEFLYHEVNKNEY